MSEIKPVTNEDEATYSLPAHEMSFSIRAPAGRTIKGMTFRRTAGGGITVVCQTRPAGEFTHGDVEQLRSIHPSGHQEDTWGSDDEYGPDHCWRFLNELADRIEAELPPEKP